MFKKFFSKLLAFLKKYWWIILIVVAVFYPPFLMVLKSIWSAIAPKLMSMWSAVKGFAGQFGWKTTAAVGLGVVSAISPSTAKKVISNVAEVTTGAVETVAKAGSSVISTLFKNPVVLIGGGVALFALLKKRKESYA